MAELDDTQTKFTPVYKDPRALPRIILRCPARVLTLDGRKLPVTVRDLSPDGLQLRCNPEQAGLIHPRRRAIARGEQGPRIQIVFRVPLASGTAVINALGRLIYFSIIGPGVVTIGLKFTAMSDSSKRALDQTLQAAMLPEDPVQPPAKAAQGSSAHKPSKSKGARPAPAKRGGGDKK